MIAPGFRRLLCPSNARWVVLPILAVLALTGGYFELYGAALSNLGQIYLMSGELGEHKTDESKAERLLMLAAQGAHARAGTARSLGLLYLHEKRWSEAEQWLRRAVQEKPDDELAWLWLGEAYWQDGQRDLAIHAWQKAESGSYFLARGKALAKAGDLQPALDMLHRAVLIAPRSAKAHLELGIALTDSGDTQQAIEHLQIAVGLDASLVEAYQYLGLNCGRRGEWELALHWYQRAQSVLPPGDRSLDDSLGIAYFRLGKLEEAEWHLRSYLSINPGHPATHYHLGLIKMSLEEWDEASIELQEAIRRLDYPGFHTALAEVYSHQGKSLLALIEYAKEYCLSGAESSAGKSAEKSFRALDASGRFLINCGVEPPISPRN